MNCEDLVRHLETLPFAFTPALAVYSRADNLREPQLYILFMKILFLLRCYAFQDLFYLRAMSTFIEIVSCSEYTMGVSGLQNNFTGYDSVVE